MMPYVNPEAMTAVGSKTKQTVIYKSESHKLHQAFPVKKDEVILQGQPVQLNTDGTIQAYFGTGIYLGIAVTDTQYPAYPVGEKIPEVTVMVEGYALCNWVSNAEVKCGYVKPSGELLNSRFVKADHADAETHFIAITPADEANELIQVLIR